MGVGILVGRETRKLKKLENTVVKRSTDSNIGSASQGVYVDENGNVLPMTYTIGSNVPSDAKFTDTVYEHPTEPGYKHIPDGGMFGQILTYAGNGSASWGNTSENVSSITVSDGGNTILCTFKDGTSERLVVNSEYSYTITSYDSSGEITNTSDILLDTQGNIEVNNSQ